MKFVQGKTVKEKFFNGQNVPLAPSHLLSCFWYLSRIATTCHASGTMFFYEIVKPVIFSPSLLSMYLSYYGLHSLSSTFLKKFYLLLQEFFLWIPKPPLEHCRLSFPVDTFILLRITQNVNTFLKIFLFARLQKPANPHKYRLFGMKKSFFVKNYFLLKRKNKGRQDLAV